MSYITSKGNLFAGIHKYLSTKRNHYLKNLIIQKKYFIYAQRSIYNRHF